MISSSLFASTLLTQREKFDDYSIFFGAKIEANAQTWAGGDIYTYGTPTNPSQKVQNGQNLYLSAAKLYFLSNIGHYVTAQFDFDTDETGDFSIGNAFAMFGNLDTSPFFVTVGRNDLSVGGFGGGGVYTDGLNDGFKPGKTTNLSINYKTNTINTNISVFASNDQQANFSSGFFYADQITDEISLGGNAGYVLNAGGANAGGISNFLSRAGTPDKMIGVLNFDGVISYEIGEGSVQFGTGWTGTTNSADFNNDGTDVLAGTWYLAGTYANIIAGRSTNFQFSYGKSYNSSDLPMGLSSSAINGLQSSGGISDQYLFGAQRAFFDNNVLIGPEYSYQLLYTGEAMNTVTLNLLLYV